MASRHGRRVPAHFGSIAAEEAVCLRSVGMADRSDRDTFELRGTPSAVESALVDAGRVRLVLVRRPPTAPWSAASTSTPPSAPTLLRTCPTVTGLATAPPPTPRSA